MSFAFRSQMLAVLVLFAMLTGCADDTALPPAVASGTLDVATGLRVSYHVHGTGPDTVVVLPGGPGLNAAYLQQSFGPLGSGRTLVFVDLRGRGVAGPVEAAQMGLEFDVADLERVRDRLRLGKMALVGHNWGAVVAAAYAASHPERVQRVVMLAPHLPLAAWSFQLAAYMGDTARRSAYLAATAARTDSTDPVGFCRAHWSFYLSPLIVWDRETTARGAKLVCAQPPEVLRGIESTNRSLLNSVVKVDLRERVRAATAPVLILAGGRDPVYSASLAEWKQALPNARLDTLGTAPHMPWLLEPARTFGDMDAFLRGQWPAGAP